MGYLSRVCGYGVAGSFAVLAGFSGQAMAEERQRAMIEEVVVTARKQEESVQDVPIAITALTQELENSSIRNLSDLDGYAPNLFSAPMAVAVVAVPILTFAASARLGVMIIRLMPPLRS